MSQRLLDRKRNVLCGKGSWHSGKIVFDAAIAGGRKSLGFGPASFEKGQLFEGLLIDPEHERLWEKPLEAILDILCFAPVACFHIVSVSGHRIAGRTDRLESFSFQSAETIRISRGADRSGRADFAFFRRCQNAGACQVVAMADADLAGFGFDGGQRDADCTVCLFRIAPVGRRSHFAGCHCRTDRSGAGDGCPESPSRRP